MTPPSDFTLFLGRLHPLLVHLPIGLIVLLTFLELLARWARFKNANACAGLILALAVPASIATAVCGLLLSQGGGYDDRLLQWHQWTGIAVAAMCLGIGWVYWLDRKQLYRLGLFATFAGLAAASHYGGSLTHGRDYLTRYAPGPLRALMGGMAKETRTPSTGGALADQRAFADVIKPVLDQQCVSCHGPEKAKAGLRLDAHPELLKGSKDGPVIVVGNPADSELIQRLKLPPNHDDHMPPEGKPQPSAEEIALLIWWVEAGAPDTTKVGDLKVTPAVQKVLEKRFASAAAPPSPTAAPSGTPPKPLAEAMSLAEKLAEDLNIAVTALAQDEPWLQCNASLAGTNFTDADLTTLAPLGPNLRWLDLAGTGVTDAGLVQVGAMRRLTRLKLERTAVTDAGLASLQGLADLESLNLYGTAVTDAGLKPLKPIPKLRRVFLWQTKVTPDAAKAFAESRVDTNQIAQWEQQIRDLQDQIRNQSVRVEVGAPASAAAAPAAIPINTVCPVSDKFADRTQTTVHEGKVVAFCCKDCKASFEKDPKPFLAKLAQFASPPPGNLGAAKPIHQKP